MKSNFEEHIVSTGYKYINIQTILHIQHKYEKP